MFSLFFFTFLSSFLIHLLLLFFFVCAIFVCLLNVFCCLLVFYLSLSDPSLLFSSFSLFYFSTTLLFILSSLIFFYPYFLCFPALTLPISLPPSFFYSPSTLFHFSFVRFSSLPFSVYKRCCPTVFLFFSLFICLLFLLFLSHL